MSTPAEKAAVLEALRGCAKKHAHLIRLKDVAGHVSEMDHLKVASILGEFQREGKVAYNLKTGYSLHEDAPLVEYGPAGGIGGRAVGQRTMFPISYQTLSDVTKERNEKLQRADETRRRTRDRLRELAQEGLSLPRRPLRPVES